VPIGAAAVRESVSGRQFDQLPYGRRSEGYAVVQIYVARLTASAPCCMI